MFNGCGVTSQTAKIGNLQKFNPATPWYYILGVLTFLRLAKVVVLRSEEWEQFAVWPRWTLYVPYKHGVWVGVHVCVCVPACVYAFVCTCIHMYVLLMLV